MNGFRDRKVAVPSNTNFATVAAIIKAGGIPVYMDIDPNSFNCGLNNLKNVHKKYNITAAMFVHIGGIISSDFPEMVEYCQQNNIVFIEDCAHAHGSRLNGINAGNFGSGGAFHFSYQVMTTMEGGMVVTNNDEHAMLLSHTEIRGKEKLLTGVFITTLVTVGE